MSQYDFAVESYSRDISTHELALVEIKRLSSINSDLCKDHNTLLVDGVRKERALAEREELVNSLLAANEVFIKLLKGVKDEREGLKELLREVRQGLVDGEVPESLLKKIDLKKLF